MIHMMEARSSGLAGAMRRLKRIAALGFTALSVSACLSDRPKLASVGSIPPQHELGPARVEPLFYNGRTYQVQFRRIEVEQTYAVNVSARGSVLGKTSADGRVMSEVGRNAINHFVCQDGQKAQVLDGSLQPGIAGWQMRARCV